MGKWSSIPLKLPRKQISSFNELPFFIQESCLPIAQYFNPLQFKIASDIILDNDSIIRVPDIDGTSAGIILGSIYKLFTINESKSGNFILFIVLDINSPVVDMCMQLPNTKHFNIFIDDIPSTIENYSKNIFICTPDKSAENLEQNDNGLTENLEHVVVFNAEELLTDHWTKTRNNFIWIPTNIACCFLLTSSCKEILNKLTQLIELNNTKKYELYQYDNLKHWVVYFDDNRLEKLLQCIKKNKYNQGVIFCSIAAQNLIHAKLIQNAYKSVIYKEYSRGLIHEYNDNKLQYIIVSDDKLFSLKSMRLNPNHVKVIINYDILDILQTCYLRRATIAPYLAENKKVHIISLIDKSNISIKHKIEQNYDVVLNEMPLNMNSVFVDENIRFDLTKLQNIKQWINDLIYGYIRQTTNKLKLKQYIPKPIILMCIFFYYDELYGPVVYDVQNKQKIIKFMMKHKTETEWNIKRFKIAETKKEKHVIKPIVKKHTNKVFPTLNNVIFNRDLLTNQVPILKRKNNKEKMNANYLWAMEHDFKHWITTVPYHIKVSVFGYIRHLQRLLSNKKYYNIDMFIIDIIIKYYYQLTVPIFLNGDEYEKQSKK